MVDFQQISMVTLAVILMINIGLISVDASDTLDRKIFGEDTNGLSSFLTYDDLNRTFENVKPPEPTTGEPCGWNFILCGSNMVSEAFEQFGFWLGFATSIVLFFLNMVPALLLGYHFALLMIANIMETDPLGPIHILFTGISAVITTLVIYGVWGMIRSIASLVPGVGN